jgi:LacI family repressor for deo operon, udp, cdd, tsx, nupC, and nupG
MVRLKDIAEQLNVSAMTVSKALRDAKDIAPETRARVRQLAEQLGYVPDIAAQGLRNRKSYLLGLVIPSVANPIFGRMVSAIEERAEAARYGVLLAQTHNYAEREDAALRRLLERRVDGVLVWPVVRQNSVSPGFQRLKVRGTPTLLLGSRVATFMEDIPCVACEEFEGSQRVTQHLLALGHRRIAYLCGPSLAVWAQERYEGYKRALREAGLEVEDSLVFHAGATIEDGEKAALQMIQESCRATAIQCANDLVAIGCGETLLGQGLRLPEDFSLAGFGNTMVAGHFRTPLTTARQPKARLGVAAVEAMLKLIAGERPELARLPTPLVIRASTAPPPPHFALVPR